MSSSTFKPDAYGSAFASVIDPDRLCELGPGRPDRSMRDRLQALSVETAFEQPIVDQDMAKCCLAAVWLLSDFLDESHTISQDVGSSSGSYWHGIMHRREPDFSNAKYWFRRVGDHPIFETLAREAHNVASQTDPESAGTLLGNGSAWDPFAFVDLCQAVSTGRSSAEQTCRQIARLEWQLLFDYCFGCAVGKGTS